MFRCSAIFGGDEVRAWADMAFQFSAGVLVGTGIRLRDAWWNLVLQPVCAYINQCAWAGRGKDRLDCRGFWLERLG